MKSFLYMNLVLAGAMGMMQTAAVAQTAACSPSAQNDPPPIVENTNTPSAVQPQTASPDSINAMNPVTGQNPDSQLNPNAHPTAMKVSDDTSKNQPVPAPATEVVVEEETITAAQ